MVEEVGARLSLKGRQQYVADAEAAARATRDVGDAGSAAARGLDDAGDKAARLDREMGGLDRGVRVTTAGVGRLGSGAVALGGALTGSVARGAGIAAVGLGALVAAGTAAGLALVGMAADAEETAAKYQTVFGVTAGRVTADLAAIPGATKDVQDAAAIFGVFGQAVGLAGTDLGTFATDLVKAGTDLGSFYNLSATEVNDKLRSGLSGETEPLRDLGIFLNEGVVEARASTMGFTAELTDQQKVLARQAEILAQFNASSAAGDFARTQGSFSNQSRIAQGELANLGVTVGGLGRAFGEELLPEITETLTGLNELAARRLPAAEERARELGRAAGALVDRLDGIVEVAAAGRLGDGLLDPDLWSQLAGVVPGYRDEVLAVRDALADLAAGDDAGLAATVGPDRAQDLADLRDLAGAVGTITPQLDEWDDIALGIGQGLGDVTGPVAALADLIGLVGGEEGTEAQRNARLLVDAVGVLSATRVGAIAGPWGAAAGLIAGSIGVIRSRFPGLADAWDRQVNRMAAGAVALAQLTVHGFTDVGRAVVGAVETVAGGADRLADFYRNVPGMGWLADDLDAAGAAVDVWTADVNTDLDSLDRQVDVDTSAALRHLAVLEDDAVAAGEAVAGIDGDVELDTAAARRNLRALRDEARQIQQDLNAAGVGGLVSGSGSDAVFRPDTGGGGIPDIADDTVPPAPTAPAAGAGDPTGSTNEPRVQVLRARPLVGAAGPAVRPRAAAPLRLSSMPPAVVTAAGGGSRSLTWTGNVNVTGGPGQDARAIADEVAARVRAELTSGPILDVLDYSTARAAAGRGDRP